MNIRRNLVIIIASLVLVFAAAVPLLAGDCGFYDGRLTELEFHFGGDALFCNQEDGCTLLSATGQELMRWSQAEIDAALAELSTTNAVGAAVIIAQGDGTYGPSTLFVNGKASGEPQICLAGFDEHGKSNEMCFGRDYVAPTDRPANCGEAAPVAENTCEGLSLGMFVDSPSNSLYYWQIIAIDLVAETVTLRFSLPNLPQFNVSAAPPPDETVACSAVVPTRGPI
ncbi:MAG TPA: hypothetical protein PLQ56_00425 [Aggregatilineales bacterium]|nr:hypothetical protein [Aggregatilineales bacterium]